MRLHSVLVVLIVLRVLLLAPGRLTAQDGASGFFVEAVVDNAAPFVGQQVAYTFRVYDGVGLTNTFYQMPDFEGFWRIDVGTLPQFSQTIGGNEYIVTVVQTVLFPTHAGQISVAPGKLVLQETVDRPERTLDASPVVLDVQPLPPGAPADFSGAVGLFTLDAALDRTSARAGEPLTLHLAIVGTGNVEQLSAPVLSLPAFWQVYQNPAVYSAELIDGRVVGRKVFEYQLVGSQIGVYSLPAITWSYFDPSLPAYQTITSATVPLEILPSDPLTDDTSVAPAPMSPSLNLRPLGTLVTGGKADYPGIMFWFSCFLGPFLLAASWGWVRYQTHLQRNRVRLRRQNAMPVARQRLERAVRLPFSSAAVALRAAVWNYFADILDRDSRRLSRADLETHLRKVPLPASLREQLTACLDSLDELRYAPVGVIDIRPLAGRLIAVLADVDKAWKAL